MDESANNPRRFGASVLDAIAAKSGMSAAEIRRVTGVTANTQKSWANGYSFPQLRECNQYAADLFVNPLKLYMDYLYPDSIGVVDSTAPDSVIRASLRNFFSCTTEQEVLQVDQLTRLPNWDVLREAFTADAHLSMWGRVVTSALVLKLARAAQESGEYITGGELPDIALTEFATARGKIAFSAGASRYGMPPEWVTDDARWTGSLAAALQSVKDAAGYSNETIAYALGRTPATVSSWVRGQKEPNVFQLTEIFRICGSDPFRPLYGILYPAPCNDSAPPMSEARRRVLDYFSSCNIRTAREIAFMIFGDHGGSWHAMLQKYCIGSRLPIHQQTVCNEMVLVIHELCESTGMLCCPDNIQPDLSVIRCNSVV